jgi:transcription factor SPN1
MSDDDNDDDGNMFEDSDDTAQLIANSRTATTTKATPKPTITKKKTTASAPKRKKNHNDKPDADNDSDDDDDAKGLFDSDSDDDGQPATKKKKSENNQSLKKIGGGASSQQMSKRERLEALANRHRKDDTNESSSKKKERSAGGDNSNKKKNRDSSKQDKGYDSGDSYDSGDFQRTAADDDFIDTTGEDADAVQELYAEQHFDDDRHDGMTSKKSKKKRQVRYDSDDDNPDKVSGGGRQDVEPDNPIMAAVYRMKKKKVEKKGLSEMEDEVKNFLTRMEMAAEDDEQSIAEKKPAMKKLAMLNEVCEMLTKRTMQRMLLDFDLLTVCKRWIQPLPNGTLGNVTVRQRLLEVISHMTGDTGIVSSDLKRSEIGKAVMSLLQHRHETPTMKRQLKLLVDQWSRPIFQKSGNMRDLERVTRGDTGLAALSRQHYMTEQQAIQKLTSSSNAKGKESMSRALIAHGRSPDDLKALIAGQASTGKKLEAGVNRVRVPYSKGFAFQVRPTGRTSTTPTSSQDDNTKRGNNKNNLASAASSSDTRNKLSKRMTEKNKIPGKNQRSTNVSVEGRVTKG